MTEKPDDLDKKEEEQKQEPQPGSEKKRLLILDLKELS